MKFLFDSSSVIRTARPVTVHYSDKFVSRPYFGDAETSVTVQQGEAAFFNCHVFNLANQTVKTDPLKIRYISDLHCMYVVSLPAGVAKLNESAEVHIKCHLLFVLR